MSRRTYTRNAFEAALSAGVSAGATSIPLDSTLGLIAPVYLVIDHNDPAKREYIKVGSIAGSTLEGVDRGLDGGNPGVAHDSGARIRAVFAQQMLEDTFSDIEDLEDDAESHSEAADPHPGYLTPIEGNLAYAPIVAGGYLPLSGGAMTGAINLGGNALTNAVISASTVAGYLPLAGGTLVDFLTLHADPVNVLHAATKQYVDAEIDANIGAQPAYLPLAGGTMAGALLLTAGTAAAPGLGFAADPDTGIFRVGGDTMGFAVGGAERARLSTLALILAGGTGAAYLPAAIGSVSAPAYSFNADPDTGMYRIGADIIGFAVGGVEKFRISATGFQHNATGGALVNDAAGSASAPVYSFVGDTNTGFYRVAADKLGFSIGGGLKFVATASPSTGMFGTPNINANAGFTEDVHAGIGGAGYLTAARAGVAGFFARTDAASGGQAIAFYRVGVQVGSIALSAGLTTYSTSSDARLKKSIKAVPTGTLLEEVRKLKVKEYSFKGDPDARIDRGLLAQEVYEVFPEAVTPPNGESEFWMIDYGRLTPLLLGALNELTDRVEALEA